MASRPWAYGNISTRNPMTRAPMNNNPMGVQAPMSMPNGIDAFQGNPLGRSATGPGLLARPQPIAPMSQLAGMVLGTPTVPTPSLIGQPANVAMGGFQARMRAASDNAPLISKSIQDRNIDMGGMGQFQNRTLATRNFPNPGQTQYNDAAPRGMTAMGGGQAPMADWRTLSAIRNTMAGDSIYGQQGIGVQRAARNVLMGQPMDADTRMRGLNIPGMQFDPARNAMVRQQRPVMNPNAVVDRTQISGSGGGLSDERKRQITATRIARAARFAGVRPADMPQWREQSSAAIAMRAAPAAGAMTAGPAGGQPTQMGYSMGPAAPPPTQMGQVQQESPFVGPPRPPVPIRQVGDPSPLRISNLQNEAENKFSPIRNMPEGSAPLVTSKPLSNSIGSALVGNSDYTGATPLEAWFLRRYGITKPEDRDQEVRKVIANPYAKPSGWRSY